MLRFRDPVKVKTKTIVFENAFPARDSGTLEQLKELSSRRKVIEDSINERSFLTEAIAREMAGGITSKTQRELQKLEHYLPLLENLTGHLELIDNNSKIIQWVSNLRIQWSSALNGSNTFIFGGPKFYRVDNLHFELGMSIYVYGATLRERAFEVFSEDANLLESSTLYRKAAGVYSYLVTEVLPPLQSIATNERPLEASSSTSQIMSLICLAEAQAVTIKRAEERKGSCMFLSKLHYGVTQMLDEAHKILESMSKEVNGSSSRLVEFISLCRALHQLKSQRYLAKHEASVNGQTGTAVAVLHLAMNNIKSLNLPKDQSWSSDLSQEISATNETLRKLEHDNEFVYQQKLPDTDELPALQGLKIVEPIVYEAQRWERHLDFVT